MTCQATPGHCETCDRRVRWADIQTCRFSGAQSGEPEARTCRDCIHQGEPILAPNGRQVGTEGCGCTSESAPSGILWWTCNLTDKPARESRAASCENFERKEMNDAPG